MPPTPTPGLGGDYISAEKKYTLHLGERAALAEVIKPHFATVERSVRTMKSTKKQKVITRSTRMLREAQEPQQPGRMERDRPYNT